jgi:hypothetical protein
MAGHEDSQSAFVRGGEAFQPLSGDGIEIA